MGIVEVLEIEGESLYRAHSDRYTFTIHQGVHGVDIFEHLGPQTIRVWRRDPPADVGNAKEMLQSNFADFAHGFEQWTYLYTEHSWFVFREHRQAWLPRVKRRVFDLGNDEVAVIHSKQASAGAADSLVYVLETRGGSWRTQLLSRLTAEGHMEVTIEEPPRPITQVGF